MIETKIEKKAVIASIFSKPNKKLSPEKKEVKKKVKSPEAKKKNEKSPEKSPDVITVCETSSNEFAPNKESYHPINSACWKKGEPYVNSK